MIDRPNWFWSSLFSSLTVNAVLFVSGACYLYSKTPIWEAGWPEGSSAIPDDNAVFIVPPIADTLLGDSKGKGTATDASPGETPMEARLGDQDQAFLSRDPEGPGRVGDPPSMSTQIPGENGNGEPGQPMKFGVESANESENVDPVFAPPAQPAPAPSQPPSQQQPKNPSAKDQDTSSPKFVADSDESGATPLNAPASQPTVDVHNAVASVAEVSPPNPTTETPPQQTKPVQPTPQQQQQQQQGSKTSTAGGGKPGPAQAAADPAPQSDSESDPFTTKGAVKFKSGSTDVQFGRKHKLVRPQIGLAGQTALLQLRQPVILVLALSLDETGKVTRVTVLQSSGSKDIDQACKIAAYQWWLEPSKDKDGKPVKDVIPFTIGFS